MSWKKVKDLSISVRVYTDSEGKTKNQYKNVGAILEDGEGKQMIMLDRSFNPAGCPFKEGSERIIINQFDPRDEKPAQRQEPKANPQSDIDDSGIPF